MTGKAVDGSVVISPPTASAATYLTAPLNTTFLQLLAPSFRGYEASWPFEIYGCAPYPTACARIEQEAGYTRVHPMPAFDTAFYRYTATWSTFTQVPCTPHPTGP